MEKKLREIVLQELENILKDMAIHFGKKCVWNYWKDWSERKFKELFEKNSKEACEKNVEIEIYCERKRHKFLIDNWKRLFERKLKEIFQRNWEDFFMAKQQECWGKNWK